MTPCGRSRGQSRSSSASSLAIAWPSPFCTVSARGPAELGGARPPDPHSVEKRDDGGGAVGKAAECLAAAVAHRLRTGEPARRQMLDQIEKERQVAGRDSFFIKGEDEKAVGRMQQKIGVLDPFGNPIVGE